MKIEPEAPYLAFSLGHLCSLAKMAALTYPPFEALKAEDLVATAVMEGGVLRDIRITKKDEVANYSIVEAADAKELKVPVPVQASGPGTAVVAATPAPVTK